MDHSEIIYDKFSKNFYEEHEDIKNQTEEQADELRKKLGIKVWILSIKVGSMKDLMILWWVNEDFKIIMFLPMKALMLSIKVGPVKALRLLWLGQWRL